MRHNKNRNNSPMKRKQKETLDEHDLLIETRLLRQFGFIFPDSRLYGNLPEA